MTATTPIYGLSYPEGSDLVSSAPDSFKSMADTFEQALDQVDRRTTPEGVKPVIATTLATLATRTGVVGQTGYVTADPTQSANGAYTYTGSSWEKNSGIWQKFTFKFENEGSFKPIPYGGANELLWNPTQRLLVVKLASFKSSVYVKTYGVYVPKSGVFTMSADISLGQAEFENYTERGIELILTKNGNIKVGPELSSGDVVRPLGSYVVPIPSNVTVTATGGTSI